MHCVSRVIGLVFLLVVTHSVYAHEPPTGLILHLPLDGDIGAKGSLNVQSELISAGGELSSSSPSFVSGKVGQAMSFSGNQAIRIPIDLSYELYPQLTVTAWVMPDGEPSGYVLSTRNAAGPALNVSTSWAGIRAPGTQPGESGILRSGRWTFIAGVWDLGTNEVRFHYGRRSETAATNNKLGSSAMDIWVGSYNDSLNEAASNLVIDDIRVYDRALTPEEIEGLALGQSVSAADETPTFSLAQTQIEVTSDFEAPDNFESTGDSAGGLGGQTSIGVMEPVDTGVNTGQVKTAADEIEEARTAEYEPASSRPMETTAENAETTQPVKWEFSSTDVKVTAVSGNSGESVETVDFEYFDLFSFSALDIEEKGNVPCKVTMRDGRNMGNESIRGSIRKCTGADDQRLRVNIGPSQITALSVCTNSSNGRVKGIEINGHSINDDGSLGDFQRDTQKHPNCGDKEWNKVVICGNEYAATGIVAHFNYPNDDGELVGLQLKCRKIEKIYE